MGVLNNRRGFTLTELIIGAALSSLVIFVAVGLLGKLSTAVAKNRVRNELLTEARGTMDTITQFLKQANPGSVIIYGATDNQWPPYSRISFTTIPVLGKPAHTFTIVLNANNHTIAMNAGIAATGGGGSNAGGGFGQPSSSSGGYLSRHATSLFFTLDSKDPTIVYVDLRLDEPSIWHNGQQDLETIYLPHQMIHLSQETS